MATVIDSLIVTLGFDPDDKNLTKFKKSLDDTGRIIKGLAAGIVAVNSALFALTVTTTKATDEQGKMAAQIGVTVEDLDAYQVAASLAGDSAEGMSNSLRLLSIRASEAMRGIGTGVEAFGLLGISVTDSNGKLKNTVDLMGEVAWALEGLGKAQQIELADKLGLRASIRLLQTGPKAIQEVIKGVKELGVTTAEDAAIAAQFQDSLTNQWQIIKQISKTIVRVFAPAMTAVNEQLQEWWANNRQLIEQRLPVFIERATRALKLLTLAVGAFLAIQIVTTFFALIKGMTLFASVAKIAASATWLFNTALLAVPALMTALIAGVLLLAQDAKTFFEGGDSVLGDLLKKFPEWKNLIINVGAALATVWDLVLLMIDGWRLLFSVTTDIISTLISKFMSWKEGIAGVKAALKTVLDVILLIGDGFLRLSGIIDTVSFDNIKRFFTSDLKVVASQLFDDLSSMILGFVSTLSGAFNLDNWVSGFVDAISSIDQIISSTAMNIVNTFVSGIMGIPDLLINVFKNTFDLIVSSAFEAFEQIKDAFLSIIPTKLRALFTQEAEDSPPGSQTSIFQSGDQEGFQTAANFLNPEIQQFPTTPDSISESVTNSSTQSASNSSQVTNINRVEISIDGAQQPTAIVDELRRQLEQASQDVGSGVYQ